MPFTIDVTEGDDSWEFDVSSWEEMAEWMDYLDDLGDIDYFWAYVET